MSDPVSQFSIAQIHNSLCDRAWSMSQASNLTENALTLSAYLGGIASSAVIDPVTNEPFSSEEQGYTHVRFPDNSWSIIAEGEIRYVAA